MEEFEEACTILFQNSPVRIPQDQIREMARSIDRNNDGNIDINEFLDAFRIVDKFGQELKRRASMDSDKTILMNGDNTRETTDTYVSKESIK